MSAGAGVLDTLDELCARAEGFVADLDADRLEPAVAVGVLDRLARLGRTVAAGEVLVTRRVEATGAHAAAGFASAGQLLAAKTGTSESQAAKVVEVGRALASCEETATALRKARVSIDQAHAVTKAAAAAPDAESALLDAATRVPLRSLERRAREVRLAADEERLGRYERQRQARTLRHGIDDDGMGWGRWSLPPDQHAAVVTHLERRADREYREAHREGRAESHGRHRADALVALTTNPADDADTGSRNPRAEVVVHVDHRALLGENPGEPGMCTVLGAGSIPAERARELLDDAFLKAVVHDGTEITKVKHFGRRRPAEIDTALEARAIRRDGDVVCDADGCDRRHGLEWDHVEPHAEGGATSLENLRPLCRFHHRLKTLADLRRMAREGTGRARAGPSPPSNSSGVQDPMRSMIQTTPSHARHPR